MNLKNQVCNLELSKRLKKLGIKQNSLFCYFFDGIDIKDDVFITPKDPHPYVSAFTVSELGDILPASIIVNDNKICFLRIMSCPKNVETWQVDYHFFEGAYCYFLKTDRDLSNAMAKMLIYLLENDRIMI